MVTDKYSQSAENLSKAIDIAIAVIEEFPPKEFSSSHLRQFINSYLDFKNSAENPTPEFRNLKSLSYLTNDVFTFFQEGKGDAVNVFWNRVKEFDLPYKRENKLSKILKRRKINNEMEYDFVNDVIVPYQQENLINEDDINLLNEIIAEFESRKKRRY